MAGISLYGLLNTGMLGLHTHKLAMSVVAHNIANTNTDGYSRQRPIIQNTPPIPANTLTSASVSMQFGTGSMIKDVQRVRDAFLDVQYRETASARQYFEDISGNMHYIEQLFAEPGDTGMRSLYDAFWASMEELKGDPTNEAVKGQVVARATELANTMKDLDFRLNELQRDINDEINTRVDQINAYFSRIADLNTKIRSIQMAGTSPNDLLDERDRLLDSLSELANIKVDEHRSGELSIRIGNRVLLHSGTYLDMKAYRIPQTNGFYALYAQNQPVIFDGGKLGALFELRDEILPHYRKKIDEFAINLADNINLVHQEGWDASGSITGTNFFKDISAIKDIEDARIFRIASTNYLIDGPVDSIPSIRSFSIGEIGQIQLRNPGMLISASSEGVNELIFNQFRTGFSISEEDFVPGSFSFQVEGVEDPLDPSNLLNIEVPFYNTPEQFINNINSGISGDYLNAYRDDDGNIFIRVKDTVDDRNLDNITFDPENIFSNMNASILYYDKANDSLADLNFNDLNIRLDYHPQKDLLRILNYGGESLDNRLLFDVNRTFLRELGFPVREVEAYKFHKDDFVAGRFDFMVDGFSYEVDFRDATNIDQVINAINSGSGGYLNAFKDAVGNVYITPTEKIENQQLRTIVFNDPEGIFSQMGTDVVFLDALDNTKEPTLNNILGFSDIYFDYEYRFNINNPDDTDFSDNVETIEFDYPYGNISINVVGMDNQDVVNEINEKSNGYLHAEIVGNELIIYSAERVENLEFLDDLGDPVIADDEDEITPTLFNTIDEVFIEINGIRRHFDIRRHTIDDIINTINTLGTGVAASRTPNGRFVLRGGSSIDFDLRNSNIKGSEVLFEKLGLLRDTGSTSTDLVQIMSIDFNMSTLNRVLRNTDVLKLDKGLGLVNRLDVTDALKANPSNLAVDLGRAESNEWGSVKFTPIGESNPTVWEEIAKFNNRPLLNDGQDGFTGFLATVIADLGIKGETASKMLVNNRTLNDQIDNERERVKGVSIDEEMGNMIKYQQAFNASARVITAVDEMIGRIVNNLGMVGR